MVQTILNQMKQFSLIVFYDYWNRQSEDSEENLKGKSGKVWVSDKKSAEGGEVSFCLG